MYHMIPLSIAGVPIDQLALSSKYASGMRKRKREDGVARANTEQGGLKKHPVGRVKIRDEDEENQPVRASTTQHEEDEARPDHVIHKKVEHLKACGVHLLPLSERPAAICSHRHFISGRVNGTIWGL